MNMSEPWPSTFAYPNFENLTVSVWQASNYTNLTTNTTNTTWAVINVQEMYYYNTVFNYSNISALLAGPEGAFLSYTN